MNNLNDIKKNINVIEANTFKQKLIGLMFKKKKIDYSLLLNNTNGIHTFYTFPYFLAFLLKRYLKERN